MKRTSEPRLALPTVDAIRDTPGWNNLPMKEQITVMATVAGIGAELRAALSEQRLNATAPDASFQRALATAQPAAFAPGQGGVLQ